jgi:hypothetical protein
VLLVLGFLVGVFLLLAGTGTVRAAGVGLGAFMLVWGGLMLILSRSWWGGSWRDLLFLYQAGIVLIDSRDPKPRLLRWADLDALIVTLGSSEHHYDVSACVLRGRGGETLRVPGSFGAGLSKAIVAAEWVLASRLAPAMIASLEAGQPVTFGNVTATRQGLTQAERRRASWQVPWTEIGLVRFDLEGQHVTVKDGRLPERSRRLDVAGVPNSVLLRYLVAHAAASAGFPVTGRAPGWDGETGYNPETTLVDATLPAPGTESEAEPEPSRKRYPARTVFLIAVITGILAGLAMSLDHGPRLGTPCTGGDCPSDYVAAVALAR